MKSLSLSSLVVGSVSIIALACSVAPAALPAPVIVVPVALEPVTAAPIAEPTAVAAPTAGPDCIDVDDEHGGIKQMALEGVLRVDTQFAHPARGKTRPLILHLQASRCAVGIPEPRVVEVQLASTEGVELKPLVGKHIRVTGEPFAAHTAWHARAVVFMTTSATVL